MFLKSAQIFSRAIMIQLIGGTIYVSCRIFQLDVVWTQFIFDSVLNVDLLLFFPHLISHLSAKFFESRIFFLKSIIFSAYSALLFSFQTQYLDRSQSRPERPSCYCWHECGSFVPLSILLLRYYLRFTVLFFLYMFITSNYQKWKIKILYILWIQGSELMCITI